MQYKHILIDANNLIWRSLYVNIKEKIVNNNIVYTGGIEQFLSRTNQFLKTYGYKDSTIIYFLFDNPVSKINVRKVISKGKYKHSRAHKKMSKYVGATCSILVEILKNYSDNFRILGGKQEEFDPFYIMAKEKGLEADDLTLPLIDTLDIDDLNRVLVISADLDWSRNIKKNVDWYNYVNIFNKEVFKNKYKIEPTSDKIKMWKALKGDSSDDIPNPVPRLNKDVFYHILDNFRNPNELFSVLWKQDYPKLWKSRLQESERQIRINYRLVDFLEIDGDIDDLIRTGKKDTVMLRVYYESLNIPFEHFMKTPKEKKNTFIAKRKYTR